MVLDSFRQDIRVGLRLLFKDKTFCFLAVLVLGLGIGGATTQFTIVNAILLRGFSFPHPDQLMSVGLIDPKVTVNFIEDHIIREKLHITVPDKVVNIIKCNNPRCVTSIEPGAPQIFHLIDRENREYRCEYCDDIIGMKGGLSNEFIHKQWVNR
jgi:hypothetical protein